MFSKLRAFCAGLHFKFMMLVLGLATSLMAAQLVTDTITETRDTTSARLSEAVNLTGAIARTLEKQFQYFSISEIDEILASVRKSPNVVQVTVVDRDKTFFVDGDPMTSGALAFYDNPLQFAAIDEKRSGYEITSELITVAEPLIQNNAVVGSVLIKYRNKSMAETVWPIVKAKLSAIIPILLLGLGIASWLVSEVTKPLLRLAESASIVAEGNLDHNIRPEGAYEIRRLGIAFKDMIGRLKANIEQIHELAYVDRVTQLPNREFFRKELTRAINKAVRTKTSGALLFVDLDGFKRVNDTLGHDLGDKLLLKFSERITGTLRAEDLVGFHTPDFDEDGNTIDEDEDKKNRQVLARLGGDEFTILLSEIREETDAATVARRIIEAVSEPFDLGDSTVTIGASIGIATFPRDGSDFQTVLKSADMAMYQAKEEGKNTHRYYSDELNTKASKRLEVENDLRMALANNELELHYQPKIDCRTGEAKSVEALVRWKHPVKGMIPPREFIKVAEECGLILPLGKWVLDEACRQLDRFEKLGIQMGVAVNISTAQFERAEFANVVLDAIAETGIDPSRLELEITESMAMGDADKALAHIKTLKELGVRFAIDDFGTGYSNLSQLSKLPFDVFKIDRSFVDGLIRREEGDGRVIVKTILAMAKSLNYETVAEGVENIYQLEFLAEYGCDFAQGYYFAKPMSEDDLIAWYRDWAKKDVASLRAVLRQGAA